MTKRNIALQIAYKGTHFHGYGIQPNQVTIQGELEKALKKLLGQPMKTHCAGRTDAGVHACAQVVNFFTEHTIPTMKIPLALQRLLPGDISILRSFDVSEDFHARFSALSRHYRYLISTDEVINPFEYQLKWRESRPFDPNLFKQVWENLVGEHNFEAFCSRGSYRKNYQITIQKVECLVQDGQLSCDIIAPSFLYNMVRALIGTTMAIAYGRFQENHIEKLLLKPERHLIGTRAPPQGLYLYRVNYPPEYDIQLKEIHI